MDMTAKCFNVKKAPFIACLTFVSILCAFLPLQSVAGSGDDSLSLSVTIESRHISHFEVCIPVKVNEPFRIVWGNEKVKDSISGTLHPPDKGEYPISLNISEGGGSCREEIEPTLKQGEPREWSDIVSSAFNHIDGRRFVLSKGGCQ